MIIRWTSVRHALGLSETAFSRELRGALLEDIDRVSYFSEPVLRTWMTLRGERS